MADVESDYDNYEEAKASEGGLHPGRSDGPAGMVRSLALLLAAMVVCIIMISWLLRGR